MRGVDKPPLFADVGRRRESHRGALSHVPVGAVVLMGLVALGAPQDLVALAEGADGDRRAALLISADEDPPK